MEACETQNYEELKFEATVPSGQFQQSSDELNYFKGAWISTKDVKIFSIFDLAHTLYFAFSRLTTLF